MGNVIKMENAEEQPKDYFNTLNSVDVGEHIEQKNGLSYLSWAWAWAELKKRYPLSYYTIYENERGWNYFTDGKTGWVKTGVTVVFDTVGDKTERTELEMIEYLPIMDFKNKSIPLESISSFDVNKSIQRSLTKAVARHGLGLYIYAGEDIPEESKKELSEEEKMKSEPASQAEKDIFVDLCKSLGKDPQEIIKSVGWKSGPVTKYQLAKASEALKESK